MLEKVVSGGQTGVDRAALDAAMSLGIPCGGWCPKGRTAEDGFIPARYPLREAVSSIPRQRTEWNVRDADGTLILTHGQPSGGTAFTIEMAARWKRPCLILDLDLSPAPDEVSAWVGRYEIRILNVAGPRESHCPRIYEDARRFLEAAFRLLRPAGPDDFSGP